MRMPAFLAYVTTKPHYWPSLARLGRNSSIAAQAIATKIEKFLIEKNIERTNQTGAV